MFACLFRAGVLCALLSLSTAQLPAQETNNRFQITVAGGAITGYEDYKIEKTADGFKLSSKSHIERSGAIIDATQQQTLTSAWELVRYRLDANAAGQTQVIEAWRDGPQIQMRAEAGGAAQSQSTEPHPHMLVLDNLVVSHFQVLLNLLGGKASGQDDWWVLVPQRLASLKCKVTSAGTAPGTLGGKSVSLVKYTLETSGVLEEFWAEVGTQKLMRVSVPSQKVELVRESFSAAEEKKPEASGPAAFVEREITFPSASFKFPATLCLPTKFSGRVPIAVFVHGSGPNDRDETIGPNKPFRDLAHGLAARGIASFRYDKRSFAFKESLDPKTVDVEQEVLADAVAAVRYAARLPEAAPDRVFLLGHSMGGMLAPFLAERLPELRGIIMMAAAARPIDQAVEEQIAYLMKQSGQPADKIAEQEDQLKKGFTRIRSGEAPDTEVFFHAPAHYWRDLFRFDPAAALSKLKEPALVLQGGKDYQVTRQDYDMILKALASKPASDREAHWFPALNHLFVRVETESNGAEYMRAAAVDPEVIDTIAAWIHRQSKQPQTDLQTK
jgi:pimeloyl-ACP methyl ester carboxylesterase